MPDLAVTLGRLSLRNPILVASGTFGYAREMAGLVDFSQLGGVIPKTVTAQARIGNPPPRTIETPCGLLNAIGLDNDGLDHFIAHHLPYLRTLPTAVIANIAGKTADEFTEMAAQLAPHAAGLAGLELNLSCPNVTGGIDFATDPAIGVGGIASVDDVMEFLVAGAAAVQLGTVNFYDPTAAQRIAGELPAALAELGATSVREVVGTAQG